MKIISGSANEGLAEAIADVLDVPLTNVETKRFRDQEIFARINENVRGEDIFLIQPTSAPANDQFLVLRADNEELVVELQQGTKFYDADGERDASAVAVGADVEVEGVAPVKADPADPDLVRAALVFIEAEEDDQVSGTISTAI